MSSRRISLSNIGLLIALTLISVSATAELSERVMKVTSPEIANGMSFQASQFYNRSGCKGDNKSPALSWSRFPKGTKSFAVTMHSPETLSNKRFWNWTVINIPPDISELALNAGKEKSGSLPSGASMLKNDHGYKGYSGPCPEPGVAPTKYQITVFALDVPNLNINSNSTPAMASFYIKQHTLTKAVITASASR
ncbi:YbhB/YbcL family Raf kinase inhibitor-like protein [Endozoicomonas ascidiicola]|uniref:YbhB/YbcL family Raf kinase inhibitor-like protein n=1 Tax=Endozoicomonas ascidiicola TaxID=1698521 RepID=UPI00083775A9|nr:YbhB/YbcL family Raf kinase inhibitor-like protein [Endozoicomonas ascidiicola]